MIFSSVNRPFFIVRSFSRANSKLHNGGVSGAQSRWTPRRIAKNEIARFRHLVAPHLAIPNPLPVPKPIPDQLPTSSSRATSSSRTLPYEFLLLATHVRRRKERPDH